MASFDKAFEVLLEQEGGYTNNPKDPGGPTKYGISKRSYPHLDISTLTRKDAYRIYLNDWWDKNRYGDINHQQIAEKVFSLAVNMGARHANKLLQRALNTVLNSRLAVDGIIGHETLDAVNSCDNPAHVLAELKLLAIEHYLRIGNQTFLRGWIRRALA